MNVILYLGIFATLIGLSSTLSCVPCSDTEMCKEDLECGPNQRKVKPPCACCYECQDKISYGEPCEITIYYDNRCDDGLYCIGGFCLNEPKPQPQNPFGPIKPIRPIIQPITVGPLQLETVGPTTPK